jgi:hypothetical protein
MEKRTRQYLRASSATHVVEFRVNADGVRQLNPKDMGQFWYSIACSQCSSVQTPLRIPYSERDNDAASGRVDWVCACSKCHKELRFLYVTVFIDRKYPDYSLWNPRFQSECQGCRIDIMGCDLWPSAPRATPLTNDSRRLVQL